MNIKTSTTLGAMAFCALATTTLSAMPTFADTSNNRIYLYDAASSTNCEFYRASGTPDTCSSGYGSYDSTTKTLTLGSNINNLANPSINIYMQDEDITIKSNSDIKGALSLTSINTLTLDFEENTLDLTRSIDTYDGTIVIESGKYKNSGFYAKNIVINDGDFTFQTDDYTKLFRAGNKVTINDGVINFTGKSMIETKHLEINGGQITGQKNYSLGGLFQPDISSSEFKFDLNDGDLNFNCNEGIVCSVIYSDVANSEININGGTLTTNYGTSAIALTKGGKMRFTGGTTTINNALNYSLIIYGATDPEHDIEFGANMGIKENIPVYWSLDEDPTSIAQSTGIIGGVGTVTITEGYTYTKRYGWDIGDGGDSDDSVFPSVPDTGVFGVDGKTTTIVGMIAALPVFATIGYAIRFLIKRNQKRIRF